MCAQPRLIFRSLTLLCSPTCSAYERMKGESELESRCSRSLRSATRC